MPGTRRRYSGDGCLARPAQSPRGTPSEGSQGLFPVLSEDERWFSLSLRVMSDDLDPDEIGALLGMEPESVGRKGQHIRDKPRYARYSTNIWVQRYMEKPYEPFRAYLSEFLTKLEAHGDALKRLTSRPGVEAALFVGYGAKSGQGGFEVPASMMARIGALGLDFELDLYPPTIDEDEGRGS